jgi:hypothetical protein
LSINFLPKYFSPWVALIFLFLSFGYAKIPYTSIPFGLIVFLVDWRNVLRLFKTKVGRYHILFCFAFLLFFFIRQVFEDPSIFLKNFLFSATLVYKSFVGLYAAYVFVYLINRKGSLIAGYIFFQISLMVISAFDENVYGALLLFQTAEATDVFGDIFGQRSVGFGLVHNEGVILLALMCILYVHLSRTSKFLKFILGVFIYLAAFCSRLLILIIPLWQIFMAKSIIIFVATLVSVALIFFDVQDGALAHVFEIYNYYQSNGELGTRSTDAIAEMRYAPDSVITWIIGDGKFFGDHGFYQDTDIGFSRIIFFGGLFGLFFYLMLNCWPLLLMRSNISITGFALPLFLMYVFIAGNVKGIAVQSFSFVVLIIYFNKASVSSFGRVN